MAKRRQKRRRPTRVALSDTHAGGVQHVSSRPAPCAAVILHMASTLPHVTEIGVPPANARDGNFTQAKGRPKDGAAFSCAGMEIRRIARWLCHPKRLMGFAVRVTTGNTDIAQCCVAQTLQLLARSGPPLPFADAAHNLVPTEHTVRSEAGHCGRRHNFLHNRQFQRNCTLGGVCSAKCDGKHSSALFY